jgi:hypothetical protein
VWPAVHLDYRPRIGHHVMVNANITIFMENDIQISFDSLFDTAVQEHLNPNDRVDFM